MPNVRQDQELEAAEGAHITQPKFPEGSRRSLACTVLSRVSLHWKAKAEGNGSGPENPTRSCSLASGGGEASGLGMARNRHRTSLPLACLGWS